MRTATAILALLLAAGLAACATASHPDDDAYVLTLRLQSRFNPDFTMRTTVTLRQPFSVARRNGRIQNAMKGVLSPPVDGVFPLDITLSEWESDDFNLSETGSFRLKLNEPHSHGAIASAVHMRTLTLTKK